MDEERSITLYTKAAARGSAGAQYNLGVRYEEGKGVEKDEARAHKYYSQSAEGGEPQVSVEIYVVTKLVMRYEVGRSVEKVEA